MPILKDRRSSPRRKQLKAGVVVFNARRSPITCRVRDISETGARIEVEQALVPDTFQLVIDLDGLEAECAVVWRRGSLIGVMFTSPPKNRPPRRVQVVTPTSPGTRPSLRRNPAK
ncbi:MAG: PilZ domain-containing protein [Rhodoplanes sp.]